MHDLVDFLAQKEVLIVLGVLAIALFLYIILWLVSLFKKQEMKKRLKNNTMELNQLTEQVKDTAKTVAPEVLPEVFLRAPIVEEQPIEIISKVEPEKETCKEQEIVVEESFTTPLEVQPVVTKVIEEKKEPAAVDHMVLGNLYEPVEILDTESPKEEQVEYKEEVYTKEEAQEELKRLTEELQKAEEENIPFTKFEDDQEENAIISLEELLEKGKMITQEEIIQYEDEGDEPISLQELEARYQKEQNTVVVEEVKEEPIKQQVKLDDFHEVSLKPYKAEKTYQPTPVISPIFGIEQDRIVKEATLALEDTATFEKLDDEIRKTNEFLSKLKELQKNLD